MASIRTIIVDDEPLARRGLELRLHGFEDFEIVAQCANGREAIEAIAAHSPDLMFLDIEMPGIDGFEVLRRIRAIDAAAGRATSALAVTAYASEDYRIRCSQAGFAGHLSKPYNINDVLRAVATAVAH